MAAAIETCAPGVDHQLSASLVRQESNFNPFAIGLDGKAVLYLQPRSYQEAVTTADNLLREGKSFSVGLSQIHISNVVRYRMTWQQAFDPCLNLMAGGRILRGFYTQALHEGYRGTAAVFAALRGFNSGDINNPVSNRYASSILYRISNALASVPPADLSTTAMNTAVVRVANAQPAVSAIEPAQLAGRVAGTGKQGLLDTSAPSMFDEPSPSMFAEAELETAPQPAANVERVAVVVQPVGNAAHSVAPRSAGDDEGEGDDGPVVVRVEKE